MIVKKYTIEPGIKLICKSHAIWGHDGGVKSTPLVYLVKPKHMPDHVFHALIKSIRLEIGQVEI